MNANDPPAGNLDPNDLEKTRVIESDPGSGTPLHLGGTRRQPQCPPSIPDHELLRVIGKGAYGEVWLARNIMGTYRAVKIVYRDTFQSDRPYEREFSGIQSFEPISRAHESQVDILHIGRNEEQRCFFYVMELADDAERGREIVPDSYEPKTIRSELKRRGRFSFAESLEICLALTTAVEHLHKHGLIHRDIKPANVIFLNGLPKLADIGLVTETDGTMSFVGTEGYLPPEGPGSVQADIYSLGKTLYEVATGKDRLEFPELPTLIGSPAEEAQLFELNEVLLKACHPEKQGRYRDAGEMHADLVLLQAGKSIRRSRALEQRLALITKIAASVLLVATLAAGAYVYQQLQTREARRLVQENRELAFKEGTERKRAEGLLNTLELKQAEHFFDNDEANKGVAYLARVLRQNPSNHIAASRLMSALTDRSFALPLRVFEHTEELHDADFSPNGQRIISCTGNDTNGSARIWNIGTGELMGKPMRHDKAVLMARFSPDGRFVATASRDGTARLWDAATGEPVSPPLIHERPPEGEPPVVSFVVFGPDGRSVATASGTRIHVWKVPGGEPVPPLFDLGATVRSIEFSSDGQRILACPNAESAPAKIWDVKIGTPLHDFVSSRDLARFSPDGSRLVAASTTRSSGQPRIYDANTGRIILELPEDGDHVAHRFSPDGLRIVVASPNRFVRVWDAQTGQPLVPRIMHKLPVWDALFDPTGERILTLGDRHVRVWDSRNGQPLSEWFAHTKIIRSATFSPDGLSVLTVSTDNTAVIWTVRPGHALPVVLQHYTAVPSARFNRDGDKAVTAAGGYHYHWIGAPQERAEAAVWEVRTGELIAPRIKLAAGGQYAEFSSDARQIVTASINGEARIWDAQTGAPITAPLVHKDGVLSARFSQDGRKVVTASRDNTARIWDAQTGQPLIDPLAHDSAVTFAEFSPDGRWVLTKSWLSRTARIWDAQTGLPAKQEFSHNDSITDARFSPDGQYIVTACQDGTALIWDRETGKVRTAPLRHQGMIRSVRFSPEGRYVVTASDDQSACIWNASTGRPVSEPLMHKGAVLSAEFSYDGQRVVTASEDHAVRVWDTQTGRPLMEPFPQKEIVAYAEFSSDGHRVITSPANGRVQICEVVPAEIPIPEWVLDLAEAIVGQRLLEQETPEHILPAQFLALKHRLLEAPETNRSATWVKWLLSDRMTRNTSPSSAVSSSKYIERLIKESLPEWKSELRAAVHFSPENGMAAATLAHEVFALNASDRPHKNEEAEFLSQLAVRLNPEHAQVWLSRGRFLHMTNRLEEALVAIERAITLDAKQSESWMIKGSLLEGVKRDAEALPAYSQAVHLASAPAHEDRNVLKKALLARATVLKRLGREAEAAPDNLLARGIPSRDPVATQEQIDLSPHYNAALTDSWHGGVGHDLASVPSGIHTLASVRWDLRGLIQVGGWETYPKRVSGISVGLACQRIHFLHAATMAAGLNEVQIGKYVAHFADGREIEIPIVIGRDLADWWNQPDDTGKPFVIAWTGTNADSAAQGRTIRLFKTAWENPLPEVALQSIDLVSTHDVAAPFLVAITAETTQPQAQSH